MLIPTAASHPCKFSHQVGPTCPSDFKRNSYGPRLQSEDSSATQCVRDTEEAEGGSEISAAKIKERD